MVALSRCLGSLAFVFLGAEGVRKVQQKKASVAESVAGVPVDTNTKFIAGVPVFNYHGAYNGESSLSELGGGVKEEEWVVVMNTGTMNTQIQDMCNNNPQNCKVVGTPDKGGVPFLEMRGTETDLERVIKSSHGAVSYVEPDQTMSIIPEVTDDDDISGAAFVAAGAEGRPSYGRRRRRSSWGLARIGAGRCGSGGAGATVFILDTGVRVSHQDFGGRAVPALDVTKGLGDRECNGDMTCAGDVQGHGTHCAGTAAGASYGVAHGAAIRSMKVLGDDGRGQMSWSMWALDWLATHETIRPAVASMSLGSSSTSPAMKNAVDNAVDTGVVVVVAAGNDNTDACTFSPAFVPSAITVGSTTSRDARSSFSNFGACTNIWAPGSKIRSATNTNNSNSAVMSGTSMACPHVAGGVALLLEANPDMQASTAIDKLYDNAETGKISGLKDNDVNKFLYVGNDC